MVNCANTSSALIGLNLGVIIPHKDSFILSSAILACVTVVSLALLEIVANDISMILSFAVSVGGVGVSAATPCFISLVITLLTTSNFKIIRSYR